MNKTIIKGIGILVVFIFSIMSCNKVTNCYDEDLYQQHKDDICSTDCPGVTGCDGETYCNECEANKNGISVQ